MLVLSLIPESKEQILAIRSKYPDYYLEYRLDLCNNWDFLDQDTVDERVILTLRDRSECSKDVLQKKKVSLSDKIKFYCEWIETYNCLVDLEQSLLYKLSAPELIKLNSNNLILSIHIHDCNWNVADMARRCLDIERSNCRYTKLALASDSWIKLQGLETLIRTTGSKVLVAFMGDDGLTKRCFYRHIGAEGTYVSLKGKPTAVGQLEIELAEILRLRDISGVHLIGGLIGGNQVVQSRGLKYYNDLFNRKSLIAAYFPLIVNDLMDFTTWLNSGSRKASCYGFSITMPYKEELADLAGKEGEVVNLWDGKKETANTDLKAMKQILKEGNIMKSDSKILILGSGSSAKNALEAIQGKAEVYICSRNFPAALALAKEFEVEYIIPENLKGKFYNVLINTTPLGMDNEDLLDFAVGVDFDTAIDLPYRDGGTPLGRFCEEKGKSYIGGEVFWKRQSKTQEEFFISAIRSKEI